MNLSRAYLALSTRDTIEDATQQSLAGAQAAGAIVGVPVRGCVGLALARNRALTQALNESTHRPIDVIVTVDDDIVFTVENLSDLCDAALAAGHPVAAPYVGATGQLQAMQLGKRWAAGLGFCAFPTRTLLELVEPMERVWWTSRQWVWPFCQEGPRETPEGWRWLLDDYWLAHALGGVELASFGVGHVKKCTLHVPERVMQSIPRG